MKTVRLGLVGTGSMANNQLNAFKNECKGVELVACLDALPARAEEFAKRHGFKHAVRKLDDLLGEVDAVSVVTPDAAHAKFTLAALKAGKHVLCEKPLTVTLADARAVARAAAAASKRGQMHMINFSFRKSAAMQKAMEIVRSGKLGALRHVHSFYLQCWLGPNPWGNWEDEWLLWRLKTSAGSGGVLSDLGCHILDLTTAVAGDLRAVHCSLGTFPKITKEGQVVTKYKGMPLDANDSAVIALDFADGAQGVCHTTRWATGHVNHVRLEVHGTEGALLLDLEKGFDEVNLCLGHNQRTGRWDTVQLEPTPSNIVRFVTSIQTGKQDQPDLLRGAQIQACIEACKLSARNGRAEKVAKL